MARKRLQATKTANRRREEEEELCEPGDLGADRAIGKLFKEKKFLRFVYVSLPLTLPKMKNRCATPLSVDREWPATCLLTMK